jgi:hypothetical protein
MKKKQAWCLVFFVNLCAGLFIVATFCLYHVPDRITKSNWEQINEGMKISEVESLLGPPNDQWQGPTEAWVDWEGEIARVRVYFDAKGVSSTEWLPFATIPPRLPRDEHPAGLDRLGEWLGLW